MLLLIEEIDHNTYECQVGEDRGRVHKSHMKIITPLNSAADLLPPQVFILIFTCICLNHTFALWCSVCSDLFFHPFSTLTAGSSFRLYMILVQVRHMKTKQGYEFIILPARLRCSEAELAYSRRLDIIKAHFKSHHHCEIPLD